MDTYKIDHVARITGLSKHVIRSWERRFHLLKPERGGNRYRMYSQEDVDLLLYIKSQLEEGFAIGELANLGRESLIEKMRNLTLRTSYVEETPLERINQILISSLAPFDKGKFVRTLNEGVSLLPFEEVFYKIFIPLQRKVGNMWHEGKIGVGEEHFVSNLIRQKFLSLLNQLPVSSQGPKVIISCLPEDYHELGSWMVAYLCAINACQVYYLGANMPVKELGAFCTLTRPSLVLLSCTGDYSEPEAKSLAEDYSRLVMTVCPIWAGGASMNSLGKHFSKNGIEVLDSMHVLEERLKRLVQFLEPDKRK
jgi:DNA-binding transcriptional MerR regulator